MEYAYNFKGLDRRIWILSITRFVRAFGRGSTFVFLPLVFISVYGLSFIVTGLLLGFATVLMSVTQYFSGRWTDRIGRRKILVYSQIPGIAAYITLYYSVAFPHFLVLAIAAWYSTILINSVQYPAVQAAVADVTVPKDRLSGFAMLRVMANLGIALGPLTGAYLAGIGLQYIFLIAAFATAAEVIMLFFLMRETYFPLISNRATGRELAKSYRSDRFFLIFIVVGILLAFFTRQRGSSLTVYAIVLQGLPFLDLGYVWALNGFLVVALQIPVLRIMTRFGNPMLWRGVGVLFYAASFFVLAMEPTLEILLISMVVSTVGEDFLSPTTQAIVTTIAPENLRGSYIGVYNLFTSTGSFSGAIIGLWLLYILRSVTSSYWVYIGVGSIAVAAAYIMMTRIFTKRFSAIKEREIPIVS
ncbi:MFS transporter [Thermoplasmatales archaeon AK]|nr:MFS transporter [Thermoplasmatales archaeon AK]